MVWLVSVTVHLSVVPSVQALDCFCFPSPHDLFRPVPSQSLKLVHEPMIFGQSGRLHEIICIVSAVVHFSTVPLVQVLVCLCFPGMPQVSLPVALQPPLLDQEPCCFFVSATKTSIGLYVYMV